ncbi:hypothetical protein SDJN02_01920, partial [Cucurbita argyrosperma subsp. argyrosperma]
MSIATAEMMPRQAASSHVGADGPFGPVIAVLVVMVILGTVAGMIGRLFSGRRLVGGGQYDVEGWVEKKCSSCFDGKVDDVPPSGPPRSATAGGDVPMAMPILPEIKEEQGH